MEGIDRDKDLASGRAFAASPSSRQGASPVPASIPDALPCIKCGKSLKGFDTRCNHPVHGVEFTSGGHYGTTVFDPMDASRIAINICDSCLTAARQAGIVGHYSGGLRRAGFDKYSIWPAQAIETDAP